MAAPTGPTTQLDRDQEQLAASAIAERLEVSMPLLSRHLAVPRATGLVAEFWAERMQACPDGT